MMSSANRTGPVVTQRYALVMTLSNPVIHPKLHNALIHGLLRRAGSSPLGILIALTRAMPHDESDVLRLLADIRALRRQVHEYVERLKREQQLWETRTQQLRRRTAAAMVESAKARLRRMRQRETTIH